MATPAQKKKERFARLEALEDATVAKMKQNNKWEPFKPRRVPSRRRLKKEVRRIVRDIFSTFEYTSNRREASYLTTNYSFTINRDVAFTYGEAEILKRLNRSVPLRHFQFSMFLHDDCEFEICMYPKIEKSGD